MDLSSLVFVAIIGVWAAYLVPHWLRRREDLSQSRTPDRFSDDLRVLQRRRKRRPDRVAHRSGDAVLTSPRVVVDADGEYLYIPADRALEARAQQATDAEVAVAVAAEVAIVGSDQAVPAVEGAQHPESAEPAAVASAAVTPAPGAVVQPAAASAAVTSEIPAARPSVPAASTPEVEMTERPFDLEIAIGVARVAARRRAVIMAVLFGVTVLSWGLAAATAVSAWVAAPATVLLVMHMFACRVAGLRSRETLMSLAVQVRAEESAAARSLRQYAPARPAEGAPAAPAPDRVARRAAAVGASTWEPVPVPPPTYTLKPAVHRPEPAPLERPAAQTGAPAAVSRGALPRRAADVERILALESHLDELFEEPKVVNG